jgi:hypothetical protein
VHSWLAGSASLSWPSNAHKRSNPKNNVTFFNSLANWKAHVGTVTTQRGPHSASQPRQQSWSSDLEMAVEVNFSFSRVMEALADTPLCAAADSSCQLQQDLLPAYVDVAAGSEDGSNASELQQPVELIHRRSASCSAIMEPNTVCLQDISLSGSHASLTSAASTPSVGTDAAAEVHEKRCHKHKHRHHHHRSQQQQEVLLPSHAAGERMVRSASVDDSHSSHASSGGSTNSNLPALIAVVEERRPK